MSVVGYSGKPVSAKLDFKAGAEILLVSAPSDYFDLVAPIPEGVRFVEDATGGTSAAHVFVQSADALRSILSKLRDSLSPAAFVWVSWPKKASKVETDVTENTIRDIALPLGYVDVKVCAISGVWSGLKLFVRKELR